MSAGSSSGPERRGDVPPQPTGDRSGLRLQATAAPFVVIGVLCVIAGGLVAAVTAPVASEQTSWASAYLVLVVGVAQVGLGLGSSALAPRPPSRISQVGTLALWNLGNGSVLAGVLLDLTTLIDIGGGALVIALVIALRTVRRSMGPTLLIRAYWLLVAILALSIPVGLVLSRIRGG